MKRFGARFGDLSPNCSATVRAEAGPSLRSGRLWGSTQPGVAKAASELL
jgi:hypothetical protein